MSGLIEAPLAAAWLPSPTWALGVVLKATVLLLFAFLLARGLGRAAASTRHLMWRTTMAGLLLLPAATPFLPQVAIPILPGGAVPELFPAPPDPGALAVPVGDAEPAQERPGGGSGVVGGAGGSGAPGPPEAGSAGVPRGLAALYAAGALGALAFFAIGLVQAGRITRRATEVSKVGFWRDLLGEIGSASPPPRLLLSAEVPVPMTWGWRTPVVILPQGAEAWPREELRQALTHELAHVERRDWLYQIVAQGACALYWFHPLAWVAARRLALEAERSADDRVLVTGADATDYAERLLAFVRRLRGRPAPAASVLPMARRSQLPARVQSLLNPQLRRSPMTTPRKLSLSLFLLSGAVALGMAQLAPADAPQTPLLEAAAAGDGEQVRRLLAEGASTDETAPRQGTPLIVASAAGDLELVEMLLAAGADPNLAETAGPRHRSLARTPLTAAAWSGNLAVVRALLDAGAEVDRAPSGDATALMEAARSGHFEIVRLLLDSGADPNRTIRGDGSPLIAAASSGDLEVLEALLAAGADPAEAVRGDGSPLIHAAGSGNRALVRALVAAGADVNRGVDGDGSPLIQAAARGDVELLEELVAAGADVDKAVPGDGNALIQAAARGHLGALRFLVEAGATVDLVVDGDENALIQASWAGHLEAVRYLVSQGADVNARVIANGHELRTPLNRAVAGGHAAVIEFLRSAGAVE